MVITVVFGFLTVRTWVKVLEADPGAPVVVETLAPTAAFDDDTALLGELRTAGD